MADKDLNSIDSSKGLECMRDVRMHYLRSVNQLSHQLFMAEVSVLRDNLSSMIDARVQHIEGDISRLNGKIHEADSELHSLIKLKSSL